MGCEPAGRARAPDVHLDAEFGAPCRLSRMDGAARPSLGDQRGPDVWAVVVARGTWPRLGRGLAGSGRHLWSFQRDGATRAARACNRWHAAASLGRPALFAAEAATRLAAAISSVAAG